MAKYRIAVMQRAVADALQKAEPDPLAEGDAVDALGNFLLSQGVQDQEKTRTKKLLCSRPARCLREAVDPLPNQDDSEVPELGCDDREIKGLR